MLTLKEEGQERNHEDQENTNNAAPDPFKDGDEIVTTRLTTNELAGIRVFANPDLRVQGTQENHWGKRFIRRRL